MGAVPTVENRVAVLVDCDNTTPAILDYALRMVAPLGRVVIRRGYGNHATLGNRWQEAMVRQAFTPHLQYQYASGKNTADIALALDALEAMLDQRADTYCLVTSDSDFAYLCRKLRERGATVCIIGESKSPEALRNASDHFFEWPSAGGEAEPERATGYTRLLDMLKNYEGLLQLTKGEGGHYAVRLAARTAAGTIAAPNRTIKPSAPHK
ncbi:MAG TPA: NYN domain-containing protein [Telluria sp.]